LQIGKDLQT